MSCIRFHRNQLDFKRKWTAIRQGKPCRRSWWHRWSSTNKFSNLRQQIRNKIWGRSPLCQPCGVPWVGFCRRQEDSRSSCKKHCKRCVFVLSSGNTVCMYGLSFRVHYMAFGEYIVFRCYSFKKPKLFRSRVLDSTSHTSKNNAIMVIMMLIFSWPFLEKVWILQGEIACQSPLGVQGLTESMNRPQGSISLSWIAPKQCCVPYNLSRLQTFVCFVLYS